MVFVNILILAAGFAVLIKGADLFVDGSVALAKHFRVPALIIGLTIVAFGTSAPELAVSTTAAIRGSNEIALSNVVGSNIFNLLMVLGLCAVLRPVPVETNVLKRDFPASLVPTVALFFLVGGTSLIGGGLAGKEMLSVAGTVTRPMAAGLLVLFAGYLFFLIRSAKKNPEEDDGEAPKFTKKKCALVLVIGCAMIIGGGQAVVYSAQEVARALGMSETLIGLTVVALGTSLPELVTSMVAARKGELQLAVGNAVGSNIFNLLLILGVSALIHPVAVNVASVWDMLILIGITAMTLVFSCTGKKQISRGEGLAMVLVYAGIVAFAIVR